MSILLLYGAKMFIKFGYLEFLFIFYAIFYTSLTVVLCF